MQDSPETQAILRRMEAVRGDLDEGAQEIAESARDMSDWRHYVRHFPWICVGAACAIGYAIVPRRPLGLRTPAEPADHSGQPTEPYSPATSGVRSAVRMFAGNFLWRTALSYATRQVSQYFAAPSDASSPEDHP